MIIKPPFNKKHSDTAGVQVKGHVLIKDDLGNVLLDKDNAIHPRNMARILARALANEPNSSVYRLAFGNGGTVTDAAYEITYRPPNDGRNHDAASGWTSRLYNETYSEVVDESNVTLVNTGPGSDPSITDEDNFVTSAKGYPNASLAVVTVSCTLGLNEPRGQNITDNLSPLEYTEGTYTFDEIGLFSSGLPPVSTSGYHEVDTGTGAYATLDTDTGLQTSTTYTFDYAVDTLDVNVPTYQTISINIAEGSGAGSPAAITYGDLVNALNEALTGVTVSFNDPSNSVNTFGYLKFTSDTTGASSNVILYDPGLTPPPNFLFAELAGYQGYRSYVVGQNAGVEDNPADPTLERERMLTHIVFSPILKSANRSIVITYTLTINVSPTT
jgi:hypothetical protein